MVSSMGGNVASDCEVVDGKHAAYKDGDVGDNGGMICGVEVLEGDMEYSGGMEVSSIARPTAQQPDRPPPCS